jgi:hypothetical protein
VRRERGIPNEHVGDVRFVANDERTAALCGQLGGTEREASITIGQRMGCAGREVDPRRLMVLLNLEPTP